MAKVSPIFFIKQEIYLIEENQLQALLNRSDLFSPYELNYCQQKPTPLLSFAGIWCAKQAVVKATNHKLKFYDFNYLDLEIQHCVSGQPMIRLQNSLKSCFQEQNIKTKIAIAHTKTLAVASVLFWL
jgi:phosphopantetheine--protein transferase-like protein